MSYCVPETASGNKLLYQKSDAAEAASPTRAMITSIGVRDERGYLAPFKGKWAVLCGCVPMESRGDTSAAFPVTSGRFIFCFCFSVVVGR